jgi:hypothetical protein
LKFERPKPAKRNKRTFASVTISMRTDQRAGTERLLKRGGEQPVNDYILFMHNDAPDSNAAGDGDAWGAYLSGLRASGQFDGGSSIGAGERVQKHQPTSAASMELMGFIRVRAESFADARRFVTGNPVYEAGGTVEIRELLRD